MAASESATAADSAVTADPVADTSDPVDPAGDPRGGKAPSSVRRYTANLKYLFGRGRTGGSGGSHAPWRSLRYRSMRWWSVANLVSNAGTWMQLTAQNLLVLQLTGSAAATGLSLSVQAGPGLLMGLFGGAVVDRWPRKVTAAVSQAMLGLVAFATAFLVATDQLNYGLLMALSAVTGIIATVDGPATSLLGNDLVRKEDVPSAIAVGSLVHSVGRLGGTALAGVAVGVLGTGAAYAANGFSFLFVAAVIPFLRPVGQALRSRGEASDDRRAPVSLEKASVSQEKAPQQVSEPADPEPAMTAREGVAFFMRRPRLVALAVITGLSAIFGRNYQLTLAVLVTGPLSAGAGAFGTVSSVLAAGGIVGAILAARLRRPSVKLVGALAAAGGLLQAVAGLSPSLILLLVLVLPMSVVESVSDTAGTTVLQTDPPANMRGRVLGVWRSLSTGWGLVAPPLLGLLMEWAGARGALVAGGLIIAAVTGLGAVLHVRKGTIRTAPATAAAYRTAA
ncbi:MFS transporter [Streptomyces purpurogeneiscleroticus]|nr:MFS transporter [Streptomyces purpurogeneiscleroticus]